MIGLQLKIKKSWPLILMTAMIFFFAISYSFKGQSPYYINCSPSVPKGIYKKIPVTESLQKGDLVLMEIPEDMKVYVYDRGWLPHGAVLLKEVGGLSGDTYSVIEGIFFVNNEPIGRVFEKDRKGLPLPALNGSYVVNEGDFLPVATGIATSFDGRYYGSVSQELIRGIAKPVVIW